MRYDIIKTGFVHRSNHASNNGGFIAAGPRCVVLNSGEIICSFMIQSALGINDFIPVISRSRDNGDSWSEAIPLWPQYNKKFSIFGSISATPSGELLFYGTRTPIDIPGESFWSEAAKGLKQNELIWARSLDHGMTWSVPSVIPMPIAGSAEAPGPMLATRSGRLICCYSPYNTFDPMISVPKNQVVGLISSNQGKTWKYTPMLSFSHADSMAAEAWVVELADGRLLGTSWYILREGVDAPNAYALSHDGGLTWSHTQSTGINGQTTALTPLTDGRAIFLYNQRKQADIGVWLAIVAPTETDFGVQSNQRIWTAEIATHKEGAINHENWTSFSFGEPSAVLLSNGEFLIVLWATQPSGSGIPFIRMRIS